MTGLNCPDSISSLIYLTMNWSCFGIGNVTFLPPCTGAMSARNGFWASGPSSEGDVDSVRFQKPFAVAEGALAHRVEDHVVLLLVPGEIPGRVVDDPVGAQAPDQLHMASVADRGHVGTQALQQLDRRRADSTGCAVDQDILPAADLCRPDMREGIVRTLGTGSGLLVGHVRRHGRERAVLGNRHVLGVSAERASLYPNTLSPTSNDVTPLPTASTTPANSVPRTQISGGSRLITVKCG